MRRSDSPDIFKILETWRGRAFGRGSFNDPGFHCGNVIPFSKSPEGQRLWDEVLTDYGIGREARYGAELVESPKLPSPERR